MSPVSLYSLLKNLPFVLIFFFHSLAFAEFKNNGLSISSTEENYKHKDFIQAYHWKISLGLANNYSTRTVPSRDYSLETSESSQDSLNLDIEFILPALKQKKTTLVLGYKHDEQRYINKENLQGPRKNPLQTDFMQSSHNAYATYNYKILSQLNLKLDSEITGTYIHSQPYPTKDWTQRKAFLNEKSFAVFPELEINLNKSENISLFLIFVKNINFLIPNQSFQTYHFHQQNPNISLGLTLTSAFPSLNSETVIEITHQHIRKQMYTDDFIRKSINFALTYSMNSKLSLRLRSGVHFDEYRYPAILYMNEKRFYESHSHHDLLFLAKADVCYHKNKMQSVNLTYQFHRKRNNYLDYKGYNLHEFLLTLSYATENSLQKSRIHTLRKNKYI